jgi:endonuclease/exonuclease/phosphatase family metal-dependent hydrolase
MPTFVSILSPTKMIIVRKPMLVFLLLLIVASNGLHAQTMNIATYNLRYSIQANHKTDSANGEDWTRRGPAIAELIRFHEFDIFGTQEGLSHQLNDLKGWLQGFDYVGVGRDDGKNAGEHSAVFYRKQRFDVLDHGDFWLSETPEKPSIGWDATCCNRLVTWALFKDLKTGSAFYVFNAHFDHQGVVARKESSLLVLEKIRAVAGENPVIFMGDLNGDHESEWYSSLRASPLLYDAFAEVKAPYAPNGTYNGFGRRIGKGIIDHVFVTRHFSVQKWGVLTDTYDGKFPSDHFPVLVVLEHR